MGGIAFLIMLGGFAALVYWYVINVERDTDGTTGFLGLNEEPGAAKATMTAAPDTEHKPAPKGETYAGTRAGEEKWRAKGQGKAYKPVD